MSGILTRRPEHASLEILVMTQTISITFYNATAELYTARHCLFIYFNGKQQ